MLVSGWREPCCAPLIMASRPAVLLTLPPSESRALRSYLQTGPSPRRISCVFKLFRTLFHPYESVTLLFSIDSELLVQNTRGWGAALSFVASLLSYLIASTFRPIAPPQPWCNNEQTSARHHREGETYRPRPVSKTRERTSRSGRDRRPRFGWDCKSCLGHRSSKRHFNDGPSAGWPATRIS